MAVVIAGQSYRLTEVDNNYFEIAKVIGVAGQLNLKPKLSNMSLSRLIQVCHCSLEMLPNNHQAKLEQMIKQITTLKFYHYT